MWRFLISAILINLSVLNTWGAVSVPTTPINRPLLVSPSSLNSFHVQARVHALGATSSGSIFQVGGYSVIISAGGYSGIAGLVYFQIADANTPGTGNCAIQIPLGVSDLTFDITRDLSPSTLYPKGFVRGSVFDTIKGTRLSPPCIFTITEPATGSTIVNNAISIGSPGSIGAIDFIRWFPGASHPDSVVQPFVSTPASFLDYEFNSSSTGNDSSGLGQHITAPLSWVSFPTGLSPVCNAGPIQTISAGSPMVLSAANSYSLNGNATLSYTWSYAGMGDDGVIQSPTFSGANSATATVTGLTNFGSFNAQLRVTDAQSRSTTCLAHNGVVKTVNSSGLIDLNAQGLTPVQQFIIGPQVAYGKNPWPFADEAIEAQRQLQTYNLYSGRYRPYWRTLSPGSITLKAGSSTVTGSGTSFKSLFCNGGTTSDGSFLMWRYNGSDGLVHYGQFRVVECTDDTHLTISTLFNGAPTPFTYPTSPNAPWPNCSSGVGCSFAYGRLNTASEEYAYWQYNPSPANYYDNVAFFLIGYWRSGSDLYYKAAKDLATYFMEWPHLDYYYSCNYELNNYSPGNTTNCPVEPRSLSLLGMALWQQQSGNAYLLKALENIGQKYTFYMDRPATPVLGIGDLRNEGYQLSGMSILSMIETEPTLKETYRAVIKNALVRLYTPFRRTAPMKGWNVFSGGNINSFDSGGSVNVSRLSDKIVGVGTSFNSSLLGNTIWTYAPPTNSIPAFCETCSSTGWVIGGDARSYVIVDVSGQILTLDRPYEGNSANGRGFTTGGLAGFNGWGFQPFMLGMLSHGFFHAAEAMKGFDEAASTTYFQYGHEAIEAVLQSVQPDQLGLYYAVHFPGCAPPMLETSASSTLYCYGASQFYQGAPWSSTKHYNNGEYAIFNGKQYRSLQNSNTNRQPDISSAWWSLIEITSGPSSSRQLLAEIMRPLAYDYEKFGTNYEIATKLMSAMFSKPGTRADSDGYYLSNYEANMLPGGWFVINLFGKYGDPGAKWAGQLGGFTEAAQTWAGVFVKSQGSLKTPLPPKNLRLVE